MFEVGVVSRFSAVHALTGDFGAATEKHGHDYRVEVAARGARLRQDGTLCDIALLKSELDAAVAELEGADLNSVPGIAVLNTTAEAVAHHLFERVAPAVTHEGVHAVIVKVWESEDSYASFEGTLGEI
jgi:6-pyruvoyltetrahydropterin/6-carboxytetrahydropterin synthase